MIRHTPPMGWNTWNTFGDKIDETLVRETKRCEAMIRVLSKPDIALRKKTTKSYRAVHSPDIEKVRRLRMHHSAVSIPSPEGCPKHGTAEMALLPQRSSHPSRASPRFHRRQLASIREKI